MSHSMGGPGGPEDEDETLEEVLRSLKRGGLGDPTLSEEELSVRMKEEGWTEPDPVAPNDPMVQLAKTDLPAAVAESQRRADALFAEGKIKVDPDRFQS